MPSQPPPTEWVPGASRATYFAGFVVGTLALFTLFSWAIFALTNSFGATLTPRDYTLLSDLQEIGVLSSLVYLVCYLLLLAPPLGSVEISPAGLVVDAGLRRITYPWSRVHRVGRRLYTFSARLGIPGRFVMTDAQAARVSLFLPG